MVGIGGCLAPALSRVEGAACLQKRTPPGRLWRRAADAYLCMRAHLVFFRILRYLCLRIFFRRFLTTEDINPPASGGAFATSGDYSMRTLREGRCHREGRGAYRFKR